MAWKDFTGNLMAKAKKVGVFRKEREEERGTMPNGGTIGYFPKGMPTSTTPEQQPEQIQQQSTAAPDVRQPGMQPPANDPITQFTSSFGGFGTSVPGGTGVQPPVQPSYPPVVPGGTGVQPPVQPSYPPVVPGGTDVQQPVPPSYPPMPGGKDWPQEQQPQPRRTRKQRHDQPFQEGNITYMPNGGTSFVDSRGSAYIHTERIVQLLNVAASFSVIDYMRNKETVVVNIEGIANEAETQRCLDLLHGAAFTMDSSVTRITQFKHVYLIAPKTVLVLAVDHVQAWTTRDENLNQDNREEKVQYRPVRGAYTPDRPDEQRRDMYQEQQARARGGYTSQQPTYAQTDYTSQQPTYAQTGYTGQQPTYAQNSYTGQQPAYAQNSYTGQQPAYAQNSYTGQQPNNSQTW